MEELQQPAKSRPEPPLKTTGMNWKSRPDPITHHQCLTSATLVFCFTFNFKSLPLDFGTWLLDLHPFREWSISEIRRWRWVWLTVGFQNSSLRCSGLGFVQTLLKEEYSAIHIIRPHVFHHAISFAWEQRSHTQGSEFNSWQLTVNLVLTATNNYHMWVVSDWTSSLTHTAHVSWQLTDAVI